ncbi:MAG: hypothetical protein ABJF50_14310 [Paracoccaceae bacterium]
MLTPVLEVVLFLSATFVLGLAFGWVLWSFSAKQEISAIATERDFWKDSYNQARLKGDSNQEFAEEQDPATPKPRVRHTRSRSSRTVSGPAA